jgi:hypothetical protein
MPAPMEMPMVVIRTPLCYQTARVIYTERLPTAGPLSRAAYSRSIRVGTRPSFTISSAVAQTALIPLAVRLWTGLEISLRNRIQTGARRRVDAAARLYFGIVGVRGTRPQRPLSHGFTGQSVRHHRHGRKRWRQRNRMGADTVIQSVRTKRQNHK